MAGTEPQLQRERNEKWMAKSKIDHEKLYARLRGLRKDWAQSSTSPIGFPTLSAWQQAFGERLGTETGLLGGELAAQVLGADIMATTAALHVARWDTDLMRMLRLVPFSEGVITIRRQMGALDHDVTRPGLADPLLVRVELLTIADERLDASRQMLSEIIQQRWSEEP